MLYWLSSKISRHSDSGHVLQVIDLMLLYSWSYPKWTMFCTEYLYISCQWSFASYKKCCLQMIIWKLIAKHICIYGLHYLTLKSCDHESLKMFRWQINSILKFEWASCSFPCTSTTILLFPCFLNLSEQAWNDMLFYLSYSILPSFHHKCTLFSLLLISFSSQSCTIWSHSSPCILNFPAKSG